MEMERPRRVRTIQAEVTGPAVGATPLPAEIVADKRDTFGRRLAMYSMVLLLLFFSISAYIESARNSRLMESADKDRRAIIESNMNLSELNRQLRVVISEQARVLRENNLPALPVPNNPMVLRPGGSGPTPAPARSPRPGTAPERPGDPSEPQDDPSPEPSPQPSPSPPSDPGPADPADPAKETVCNLTGICL